MRTAWAIRALAVPLAGWLLATPYPAVGQSSSSGQVGSLLREAQQALQAEDYQAAERYFRQAAAADPTSPDATCGMGQVHMALRQYEEAVRSLESCKKLVLAHLRELQVEQTRAYANIETEIREVRDTIQAIRSGGSTVASIDRPSKALEIETRATPSGATGG